MQQDTFKFLHLCGLALLMLSLGGVFHHRISGGVRNNPWRYQVALTHGIGLFLLLASGLGMAKNLALLSDFPLWLAIKVVLWLAFGLMLSFAWRRAPESPLGARRLWWAAILYAAIAAYLGINKSI